VSHVIVHVARMLCSRVYATLRCPSDMELGHIVIQQAQQARRNVFVSVGGTNLYEPYTVL